MYGTHTTALSNALPRSHVCCICRPWQNLLAPRPDNLPTALLAALRRRNQELLLHWAWEQVGLGAQASCACMGCLE